MKRALLTALLSVFCVAAAPSAKDCKSLCARSEVECKKNCQGDAECAAACTESTALCPKMCVAMMKHQGDPARMGEAMRQVHEREASEKQAREDAHTPPPRGHQH